MSAHTDDDLAQLEFAEKVSAVLTAVLESEGSAQSEIAALRKSAAEMRADGWVVEIDSGNVVAHRFR